MADPFLPRTGTTAIVNVKLTDKGRELLTKGFFDQDTFDIVKFAFGDSEVDYSLDDEVITGQTLVTDPDNFQVDFKSKLYASGTIPEGTPLVSTNVTDVELGLNQNVSIDASTVWPPVEGNYAEVYKWTNLGPLEDYEISILVSNNTRTATIISYDVSGTAKIKVQGLTSGKYKIVNLTVGG